MAAPLPRRAWLAAGAALASQSAAQLIRFPRTVRAALIDLDGHIGEILTPLKLLPDLEFVAIADPVGWERQRLARFGGLPQARRYKDYRELLDREKLDLVAICGQNSTRAQQIVHSASRGVHIVAEKPLAIDRAGMERVRQAVRASGVRLTMLLPMRFSGVYRAMQQIAASGVIGEVAQISAQKSYKLGNRPDWIRNRETFGTTIPYIGVHMIDLMRWISRREFLEVSSYQSRVGQSDLRDMQNTTACLFRMDNGGVATLHMDFFLPKAASAHGDDRLRLAGTRGVLEFRRGDGLTLVTENEKVRTIADFPPDQSLFVDFLNATFNGQPAGLTVDDVFRVSEIALAAQEASGQLRAVRI